MIKAKLLGSLALALLMATVGVAQDEPKTETKAQNKAREQALKTTTNQMMKAFTPAKLTDEQKEKAVAIIEKHIDALLEARQEAAEMLSKDQKKAKRDATKQAKEDGLKGPKAAQAVELSLGLEEDKLNEYRAAMKKPQEVNAKIKEAIKKILTEEQVAALPAPKKRGKAAAEGKGKKKEMKKADGEKDKTESDGNLQTVSLRLPNMT